MIYREKVIKALEHCKSYGSCEDEGCPYYYTVGCLELLRKDALELIKEQEAKMSVCDKCGLEHPADDRYCPRCGKSNFD